jgi:hypothetical protein
MINNKSCFVLKSFSLIENHEAILNDFYSRPLNWWLLNEFLAWHGDENFYKFEIN